MGSIKAGSHGRYEEGSIFLNIIIGKISMLTKYLMTNAQAGNISSLVLRHKFQ